MRGLRIIKRGRAHETISSDAVTADVSAA